MRRGFHEAGAGDGCALTEKEIEEIEMEVAEGEKQDAELRAKWYAVVGNRIVCKCSCSFGSAAAALSAVPDLASRLKAIESIEDFQLRQRMFDAEADAFLTDQKPAYPPHQRSAPSHQRPTYMWAGPPCGTFSMRGAKQQNAEQNAEQPRHAKRARSASMECMHGSPQRRA